MQDINTALFALLAIAVTAGTAHWWYGRQRHRFLHRLGKLTKDRDALHEQLKELREQVAQLQKELMARRSHAAPDAARPAPARPELPPAPPRLTAAELASGLLFEAPQLAAHGFADTQPFSESTFPGLHRHH